VKSPVLTIEDVTGFLEVLIPAQKKAVFNETTEVDFSFAAKEKIRFRCNAYYQQGTPSVAMRHIPNEIRTLEELNLPPILESFTSRPQGFFLCVGPVGQG